MKIKALRKSFKNKIRAGCEPSQFAVGTNGGGLQVVMAITLLMEANPDWVVIALDIANTFNEIQRYSKRNNEKISSFNLYGTTTLYD